MLIASRKGDIAKLSPKKLTPPLADLPGFGGGVSSEDGINARAEVKSRTDRPKPDEQCGARGALGDFPYGAEKVMSLM